MNKILFPTIKYIAHHTPQLIKPVPRFIYQQLMKVTSLKHFIYGNGKLEACHNYWINPTDETNKPVWSLRVGWNWSDFMLEAIRRYPSNGNPILEIGCHSGRNLWTLYKAGYHNLAGIEISTEAVDLMKSEYPEMAKNIEVYCSPVEDIIRKLPDSHYLVFTLAVLEHIHPDSEWIFEEMVRITDKYLITLEDEVSCFWRTFSRNYQHIFEGLGMKQIEYNNCKSLPELYGNFKFRVFQKIGLKCPNCKQEMTLRESITSRDGSGEKRWWCSHCLTQLREEVQ